MMEESESDKKTDKGSSEKNENDSKNESQVGTAINKEDENKFVQPSAKTGKNVSFANFSDDPSESLSEPGTSSDSKGLGKGKRGKGKQNWKNRFLKQKQKGSATQDTLENVAKRHAFHSNFKFRTGRKRSQSYPAANKFFLPKRPRKETFIPPTKFLLGGNISDPLNLNSLQDEDINRAMNAVTPKSSPLPTPPRHKGKIEVIIPPDIRDPLNLLNPVDNAEYEKRLESKGPTRRARKRSKAKRKQANNTETSRPPSTENSSQVKVETSRVESQTNQPSTSNIEESVAPDTSAGSHKDLRLDLSHIRGHKRTISESEGSTKGKDSKKMRRELMDKIVSPVIPQPGAWKRMHPWAGGEGRGAHQGKGKGRAIPARAVNTASETKPVIRQMPKFRPQDARFQYGNYDRYYGYRNLDSMVDIRLKVFGINRHLFHNKDILDIGCNVGHITIAVARDLGAKSVTGIDIDKNLIFRARQHLAETVICPPPGSTPPRDANTSNHSDMSADITGEIKEKDTSSHDLKVDQEQASTSGAAFKKTHPHRQTKKIKRNRRSHHKSHLETTKCVFPISFPILYGPAEVSGYASGSGDPMFPHNIVFKECNYILKDENLIVAEQAQFDLILCLSVTKWFHLNWGDAGLKLAFKRMFAQLRPGGKLILEAQSLSSYKRKKNLTETIYKNFSAIEFFPNKFRDYLLSPEVGFSKCCVLGVPQHLSKGFRRPIQLFIKGDFTPSKVQWSDTYAPSSHHQMEANIENQPKKVYANAFSPSYNPSNFWGGNTPLYGAATPYSPKLDTQATEDSPFYNPRSDSYLPSYTSNSQTKTVYASLSSPQNDYSVTPVHISEGGIPPTIGVYASLTSPASPFLEPSPGDSGTPSHPFTPSHSATYDAQSSNKKVYASLPSPPDDRPPVYSPSVACPSRKTPHSPLHTGAMLHGSVPDFTDVENTNSSDSLQAKGYEHFTPTTSPSREVLNTENSSGSQQSPKETSNDVE